ncbi:Adenosylmethionine-8-amino-7-oxononanoate aminotransferase [hydrothermal vent metagenome]|uniref:Adenosylmethionine-8-amino-7-oxononanoate aminotransferase n=1 Tax=hydrothermal vent metagenome TaxID=652676 RepID=A0A3B1E428_9ZZZZ
MNYLDLDTNHTWHPYSSLPSKNKILQVKSTHEQTIVLEDGTKLIDAMSSWWSAIHGYNHRVLLKALEDQASIMPHVMFGGLTHEPAVILCEKLAKLTKLSSVFLADSGSVAVEVALKTAILYQKAKKKNVFKFIALNDAYHGDTLGCMGVCDPKNSMHSLYGEYLPKNIFTSIEYLEETIHKYHKQIAGVIVEPIVQGAGGMKIHTPEYLKIARKLCTKYDLVLIADEIATGFGHTGLMWGCDHANITPDIMTVGKSLTGGVMTLSAMCTTKKISDMISNSNIGTLMHGPTFMGNALACAVANASIDLLLSSSWKSKVLHIETLFKKELISLKDFSIVEDVRCIGVIGVVELKDDLYASILQNSCVEFGVWIRPFGRLLYSIVSYNISNKELYKIINAMKKSISKISTEID